MRRKKTTTWRACALGALVSLSACSVLDRAAPWPMETVVAPPGGRHALVIVTEPGSACTGDALVALADVMTETDQRARAIVLFTRPAGDAAATVSDLWWAADELEGVRVIDDPGGFEAAKFNARPDSVLRYSPRARLVSSAPLTCAAGRVQAVEDLGRAFAPQKTAFIVAGAWLGGNLGGAIEN